MDFQRENKDSLCSLRKRNRCQKSIFFSCRFVICWFNLKNVVAHKTNINLFKMSSEEDKPPAPPVRLTSTNRGKFNFKCIQFHTLGWNAISLECRNSIPYSFTRIINAKSKCASHIRVNTYHIRLSAANLVLTFYVCFFSLFLSLFLSGNESRF